MTILRLLLLSFILFQCKTIQWAKNRHILPSKRMSFASQIPSGKESGLIYYKKYSLENSHGIRVVRSCYLQHGYGIDQKMVNFKRLTFDNFVHTYYSLRMIRSLLELACSEVIIALQESNQTSILTMTERTEKFLNEVVCAPREQPLLPGQKPCAFIGHSKGGAVAFNLARRCMQKTSTLGAKGCSRLREIYSATGVIQGARASFAVYGAFLNRDKKDSDNFIKLLGFGINLVLPAMQELQQGKTNPTWYDLNPFTPMENGVPLYVINDIALEKKGWLVADFAASGVAHSFSGKDSDILHGCGPKDRWEHNYNACRLFGNRLHLVHSQKLQSIFAGGLKASQKNPVFSYKKYKSSWQSMTWQNYQVGDGLADFDLSIQSCRKGLTIAPAKRAVTACTVLPPMNHLASAGGSELAVLDMIKQLVDTK